MPNGNGTGGGVGNGNGTATPLERNAIAFMWTIIFILILLPVLLPFIRRLSGLGGFKYEQ